MRVDLYLLIVVLSGLGIASCGPEADDSDPSRPASGGTGGGQAGSSGGENDLQGGAAGTGGGSSGSPAALNRGSVLFGTFRFWSADGDDLSHASASFQRASDPVTPCTTTMYGPCRTTSCPTEQPALTKPDAGTITIASGTRFEAVLQPTSGAYQVLSLSGGFEGGETVTVAAAGGEVPAFTATHTFPVPLLITAPDFAGGLSQMAVPRNQELILTWDGGVEGVMFQAATLGLNCTVPSEDGMMVIPIEVLSQADSGAELNLFTTATGTAMAADYRVNLTALASVLTPDRTRRASFLLE